MGLNKYAFIQTLQKSDRLDPFFVSEQHYISQRFGVKENLIQTLARDIFDRNYNEQTGTIHDLSLLLKELPIKHFGKEFKNIVQTTQYLGDIPTLEEEHCEKTIAELTDIFAQDIDRGESNAVDKSYQKSSSRIQKIYGELNPMVRKFVDIFQENYNEIQSIIIGYRSMNPMMRKFVVEFLTECISTNLKIKSLTKKIKSQYSNLDLIHDTTFEAQRIGGVHNIFQSWMTKRLSPQNGIAFTSHGHENLPLDGKCLLAPAPHQSLLDTPSIMREISVPHISLAVDRFKNKPIFGYTYQSGTVMFDENDPKGDGMRAMNDLKNLVDQGVAPLIFPEGERNTTDKLLLPIKPGFAILALEKNLPIVPIAIIGTKDILPVGEKDMYPGHIHIEILPSIILTEEEKLDYDTQYNQLGVDPTPLQLTKIQIKFIRLLSQRYEEAMLNYLSK